MNIFQNNEFIKLYKEGMNELEFTTKAYIYQSNEELFSFLDFENSSIFFEPLLFKIIKENNTHLLNQVLFGYIHPLSRPKIIEVYSDNNGIIFIPHFGYFITKVPNESFNLVQFENKYILKNKQGKELDFQFAESDVINKEKSSIELYKYNLSWFSSLYIGQDKINHFEELFPIEIAKNYSAEIYKTLDIISIYNDKYFKFIESSAKSICLFNYDSNIIYSFAGIEIHGAIFLNVQKENSIAFFISEFAHQFGHCILNTILFNKDKIYKISFDEPVKNYTGNETDHRTIEDTLHGLFTTYSTAEMLINLMNNPLIDSKITDELKARFIDNYYRFETGIEKIDKSKILTETGVNLFDLIANRFVEISNNFEKVKINFNVSNQEFVFNYPLFLKTNTNFNETKHLLNQN